MKLQLNFNRKEKKMNLELKILTPDSADIKIVEEMNNEAFPDNERMTMDEIFAFVQATNTDFLGVYDEGRLVGYIVLLKNEKCGYVFFYAIGKDYRSKGYGGSALKELFKAYSDLQIILDFEKVDEKAENFEQRVRRKSFYLRNGFHETGHYTLLKGEPFEVVCSEEQLNIPSFKDLIKVISSNVPSFPNVLI